MVSVDYKLLLEMASDSYDFTWCHCLQVLLNLRQIATFVNFSVLPIPADTDVFKSSSGRLKKVATSSDQTRRHQDVWKKTSDLRRLEDA